MGVSVRRKSARNTKAKARKKPTVQRNKSTRKSKEQSGPTPEQYEQLVLEHRDNGKKLARSMLRKWRVRMPAEEIDSIVDLTLCEAASRFCSDKGASFMTFFFYHLRGNLVRAVTTAAHASNVFLALTQNEENESTSDWTFTRHDVLRLYLADQLNEKHNEIENPETLVMQKEREAICRKACSELDELEQTVLIRSYKDDESLVDIARSLGYSRCHISRVKKRALERLKISIDSLGGRALTEKKSQVAEPIELVKRRARRRQIDSDARLVKAALEIASDERQAA